MKETTSHPEGIRWVLESTLVIVMVQMGRTPRVNGKAGRDHWPHCIANA